MIHPIVLDKHTLSLPARSTKWNLETTVTHSPEGSSTSGVRGRIPNALDGLSPVRDMAAAKLGVGARPKVGEDTREEPTTIDPGRAIRDGEGVDGAIGDDRAGTMVPVNFF